MEYRVHIPPRLGFSASLSSSPQPGTVRRAPVPTVDPRSLFKARLLLYFESSWIALGQPYKEPSR
jgi:hypothetical protein